MKALVVLRNEEAHSDVVREAQEIVELALKGALRAAGVEPPKYHDVGTLLIEHASKLGAVSQDDISRAAEVSRRLRKERELSFYGDVDFIPTEQYGAEDAQRALRDAEWVVDVACRIIRAA